MGLRDIWNPRKPFNPSRFPIFYGWIILFCSTLGIISSIPGQTVGVSVFTDKFVEVLGISRIQLTSAYLVGTGLSGFFIGWGGKIFDRIGARRFFVYVVCLFGCALLFMSQMDRVVNQITRLIGYRVGVALFIVSIAFLSVRFLGQGMVMLASQSMLSKWWNRRRGKLISYSGIFVSFGFSITPKFFAWEMEQLGWRLTFVVNALILICFVSMIGWLFVRDNPEECDLEMDGGWKPKPGKENSDLIIARDFNVSEARKTYVYWLVTLLLGFQGFFATAYTFHVLDIARHFEVSKAIILNLFVYSAFLSISANLFVGHIADKIRLRMLFVIFGIFGAIFAFGVTLLPQTIGLYLVTIGMGATWGMFPVIMNVTFVRYFGRKHIGAISGSSYAFMVWGSALGPLCFSLSEHYLGGYNPIMIMSMIVYTLFMIAGFWAINPQTKILMGKN